MIKLKKILYPTDFSESSLEALKYAISFARSCNAKLVLLYVVNENIFSEGLSLPRPEAPEALGKEMADEAARRLKMVIPAGEREAGKRQARDADLMDTAPDGRNNRLVRRPADARGDGTGQ